MRVLPLAARHAADTPPMLQVRKPGAPTCSEHAFTCARRHWRDFSRALEKCCEARRTSLDWKVCPGSWNRARQYHRLTAAEGLFVCLATPVPLGPSLAAAR